MAYVYGLPGREHVLVWLSPEISGEIVAEKVTQTVPLDAVRSVTAA